MKKFFTMKRLRVAWKIIRPALGVLTISAPGSREAKIASVVMSVVAKNSGKNKKLAVRYQQALVAKARLEQLVKMYKLELEEGQRSGDKLLAAVGGEMKEAPDADGTGQEV
jgi:hypothetical protein